MANKGCEGNCYPAFVKAGTWKLIKQRAREIWPEQNTELKK
jgi:hypothetical protein